jgi:hypothetical protein
MKIRRGIHVLRPGCGRNRATRAAPDWALVRTPERALNHCGVAPRLSRHFFFGCRYSGKASKPGSPSADAAPVVWAHDFSKSLAPVLIEFSTSRAACWTLYFILLKTSSCMERLSSLFT